MIRYWLFLLSSLSPLLVSLSFLLLSSGCSTTTTTPIITAGEKAVQIATKAAECSPVAFNLEHAAIVLFSLGAIASMLLSAFRGVIVWQPLAIGVAATVMGLLIPVVLKLSIDVIIYSFVGIAIAAVLSAVFVYYRHTRIPPK